METSYEYKFTFKGQKHSAKLVRCKDYFKSSVCEDCMYYGKNECMEIGQTRKDNKDFKTPCDKLVEAIQEQSPFNTSQANKFRYIITFEHPRSCQPFIPLPEEQQKLIDMFL